MKLVMVAVISALLIAPPVTLILKRSGRLWLKKGVEGANEKPDIHELWESLFMYMALGCFFLMVYMILDKSIHSTRYEIYEYLMVFSGTMGSNGASAFIIWAKQKYSLSKR